MRDIEATWVARQNEKEVEEETSAEAAGSKTNKTSLVMASTLAFILSRMEAIGRFKAKAWHPLT